MRDLIDPEDGENRAVRAFLMHYGAAGLSVGQMKTNLRMSGWNGCWPAWCDEPGEDKQHLTKAGAQLWLRHLFALESTAGVMASCEWSEEDPDVMPGTYATSCGELWAFTEGGAKENGMKFCHNCGKPVHVVERPAEPEDDDGVKGRKP